MTTYTQADGPGLSEPGWQCRHCGSPGFEHERERVHHDDGTYSYDLVCPDGDGS